EIDKETFKDTVVIPCINDDGFRTLLIKNSEPKRYPSSYTTKYLLIKRNVVLVNAEDEYFCHLISCRENSEFMNHNFDTIYEYLFKKIESPIDEYSFSDLMNSIEELFSKNSENL